MSIYARSFTISFGRSPCPGQLPSSLRLPLSGRPPVVSKLLLHVLFCFTIRFSRYHAVRSLFASLRQLRYYITPLPLCQHFFRSLDFLDYFPFFPLFHSLFCTFRSILQINILRFLRNIFCFLLFYLSARIGSKACPLPILLHCFIIGLYFYELVVNAANAKFCRDFNGVDAIS